MASIQMNMGTETEINATPNKDGLILFDTTNKKIILNNNGTREVLTKHIEANPNLNGAEQLENLKVNGEVLNFLPVDISNVEKDGEAISDILEDKYNTEGDYNTTVDKCTDLTRVSPVTDTAPYIYRQTPVKESFKALMKKIVGASVVWNQLISRTSGWNGITPFSSNIETNTYNSETRTRTIKFTSGQGNFATYWGNSSPQALADYANHIILYSTKAKCDTIDTNDPLSLGKEYASNPRYNLTNSYQTLFFVNRVPSSAGSFYIGGRDNTETKGNIYFKDEYTVDLTAMFGTTIADYVYTLETSQSGSGIAWLQSYGFFTEDYYAYKQNKLESGCVSAHKTYDGETLLTNTELSPITLRGLFKLSTDKLTVDGDEYNADGSVTRNYGVVNLGDLDWTYKDSDPNTDFAYFQSTSDLDKASNVNLLCARYITMPSGRTSLTADKTISTYNTSSQIKKLVIRDDSYTDAQTFKTAMSGVYLIYELATPTTEQATPFTETEIVGSTEEFIDYEVAQSNRDVAIPVGTDTDYYQSYDVPPIPFTSCYLCASNQKLNWVSN